MERLAPIRSIVGYAASWKHCTTRWRGLVKRESSPISARIVTAEITAMPRKAWSASRAGGLTYQPERNYCGVQGTTGRCFESSALLRLRVAVYDLLESCFPASSAMSHALAILQSRFTVSTETPRTSAVSSIFNPPK
jgi:hypothetical protein